MIAHQEILDFWFDGDSAKWWKKDPDFDADVRERFGDGIVAARSGEYDGWMDDETTCLAAIILLDQFSRNAFRDTPDMFSADEKARTFSKVAIARGFDVRFDNTKRAFLYMPLMHSEHRDDQAMCVALFEELAKDGDDLSKNFLDFAKKHREIVDRFNRYPHRNNILGRTSTDEEIEFLAGPGSSF